MTPRLKEIYNKEIQPALKDSLGLKNIFMTPKIEKVVLNMGLGLDGADAKILKAAEEDMGKITGQKPVITKFKKSVANFKTRKGSNAGLKVTLRKNKMYEFIDRLVNIALPRIKDFRGLSPKGFDKFGNYTALTLAMVNYLQKDLINLEIIHLVLKSILFFQKLVLIERIKLEV